MTETEEQCSMIVIEFCRKMNRKAAEKYAEVGARPDDIALGAVYSAYDLATVHNGGDPVASLEWLRRALDMLEEGAAPLTVQ